jgi:hypothetical protein
VGLAHGGAWPGPANGFGPRPEQENFPPPAQRQEPLIPTVAGDEVAVGGGGARVRVGVVGEHRAAEAEVGDMEAAPDGGGWRHMTTGYQFLLICRC